MRQLAIASRLCTVHTPRSVTIPKRRRASTVPDLQRCRRSPRGLSAANPRFAYHAVSFDLVNGGTDNVKGTGRFNPWKNTISTEGGAAVAPDGTDASNTIAVDSAEWALTPSLGMMVVTLDNRSGARQAQLIKVDVK